MSRLTSTTFHFKEIQLKSIISREGEFLPDVIQPVRNATREVVVWLGLDAERLSDSSEYMKVVWNSLAKHLEGAPSTEQIGQVALAGREVVTFSTKENRLWENPIG